MMAETSGDITLKDFQRLVNEWIDTVGHGYYAPLTNMAILTEEVGEVARIMAREYGEQTWREGAPRPDLGDELADILWVVAALANQTGTDLTVAVGRNIEKKTVRDAARHRDNPKKTDKKY